MPPAHDLFHFPDAARRDPTVEAWFARGELHEFAKPWFELMHACGEDVRELLHDGMPTACVGDAAFAYVNAFTTHVNVGFFQGASLPDPEHLLEGSGKRMRHVKRRWGAPAEDEALRALIAAAYADMKRRLTP